MNSFFDTPLLGIGMTIIAYEFGVMISKKVKSPLMNPMIFATGSIILGLLCLGIPYETYEKGAKSISVLLPLATTVLGLSIYHKWQLIKKHVISICFGCFMGSLTSVTSVYFLSKFVGLEQGILHALLPRSVTTPIALDLAQQLGAIADITIMSVVITGALGALLSPWLIRVFRIKGDVAKGISIGTSSHVLGTSKAVEMGESIGAFSSLAIGISGIFTVFITMGYLLVMQ